MSSPADDVNQPTPVHPKIVVNPGRINTNIRAKEYWRNVDNNMVRGRDDSRFVQNIYQNKVNGDADAFLRTGIRVDYNPFNPPVSRQFFKRRYDKRHFQQQ